jgi:ActR/RegA family two-component response regulator
LVARPDGKTASHFSWPTLHLNTRRRTLQRILAKRSPR